jgi:hypothetical protein
MRQICVLFASLLLATALCLPASAATVQFVGSGSLTDGSHYIGPYQLNVDGRDVPAMCFDFQHTVSAGQTWEAQLLALTGLGGAYFTGVTDYQARYEEEAWLYSQLVGTSDAQARIGIQHAAWMLFTLAATEGGAGPWMAAAAAARAAGFPGLNLADYRVVVPLPDGPQVQGFLIAAPPAAVPEPSSFFLAGCGMLLVALFKRRR